MTSRPGAGYVFVEKVWDTSQAAINYAEISGSGPPFILLHGLGRTWQDFLPLLPAFSRWKIYALDLRGHGKSGRARDGYQIASYASDIVAFLENNLSQPVVIFGHSLGGVIGLQIAATYPQLARAIILGDCALSQEALKHSMYDPLFTGIYELVKQSLARQELARKIAKLEIPVPGLPGRVPIGDLLGNGEAALLQWTDCLLQVDPEAIKAAVDGSTFQQFDAAAVLARIACPMMVLQANPEFGGLMSDTALSEILKIQPRTRVVRLPLLGHSLHLQRVQPVIDALLPFLKVV